MLGVSGYILSGLYDAMILFHKSLLRKLLSVGLILTAGPYPFLFVYHESPLPGFLAWMLLLGISVLAALLIYSVFLEIPLATERPDQLFRSGTYSFSRHPGFLWYTGVNILVSIYFWEVPIALLSFGLTLCNLVLITVEDLYLFPKIFPEYPAYRKETPFLFPIHHVLHRRNLR